MKFTMRGAGAFAVIMLRLSLLFGCVASSQATSPLAQVTELLQGMLVKAKDARKAEAVQWTAYKQWCTDTEGQKQADVKKADMKIEQLTAMNQKFSTEVERLTIEIEGHEKDVKTYKEEIKTMAGDRKAQHSDFEKMLEDYTESIYALEKAIQVLKSQDKKTPQAAALLQQVRANSLVSAKAGRAIQAYLALDSEEPDLEFVSPPEANAYEFQSGGIIALLKDLLDKFQTEKTSMEKKEMENRHAHDMTTFDLSNSVKAADSEIQQKTEAMMKNKQDAINTKAELDDVTSSRAEDANYLEDLAGTCREKATDFESRQQLRADEMEVIEKVIALLSSEDVTGAAAQRTFLQQQQGHPAATTFVQLQSAPTKEDQDRAAAFLREQSNRLNSDVLSALAMRVEDDPFGKVKKMIQDLIERLKQQASEEAEHKAWCDAELEDNGKTRTDKTKQIDSLRTEIEQLDVKIAQLDKEVGELSSQVAELTAALAKATTLRDKEKAENEDTIAQAVGAQMELANAIKILKEFYGKAGSATAMLQRHGHSAAQAPPPPTFDTPYKGLQKENDNVLSFLDVIQSDFARLEQETSHAEGAAQAEYEKLQSDTKESIEMKDGDIKKKEGDKINSKQDLVTAKHDLGISEKELDAAMKYYDKLRPSCINEPSTFEDRQGRRQEEITSLKEALSILSGEELPTGPSALYSSVVGGNVGRDVGVAVN